MKSSHATLYVRPSLVISATVFIFSFAVAKAQERMVEEPPKVVDINQSIMTSLQDIRASERDNIGLLINSHARKGRWPLLAHGYKYDSDGKRIYGSSFIWLIRDLRVAATAYEIGIEEPLPNNLAVMDRSRKYFVEPNCTSSARDFEVNFEETFKEQRTWSLKKTVSSATNAKLSFGSGPAGGLGGEVSTTNTIETERATGTMKDKIVTWKVTRRLPINPFTVILVKAERDVRSVRIPFHASLLVDADIHVAPDNVKGYSPVYYKNLIELLPDQSKRTFQVEGYIDDVSVGREEFSAIEKAIEGASANDTKVCVGKGLDDWYAEFLPSEKATAFRGAGKTFTPAVPASATLEATRGELLDKLSNWQPLPGSSANSTSCTAKNEEGGTCSISCSEGQAAYCQDSKGRDPPLCKCVSM